MWKLLISHLCPINRKLKGKLRAEGEPKLEPRQGRKTVAGGGAAEPRNHRYNTKRKWSPERRSEATQRRPTDNGEDRSEATLRAGTGACLFVVNELRVLRIATKTPNTQSIAFCRPPLCRYRSVAPGSNIRGGAYRWFRRCATPPPATVFRPYRGLKFRSLRSPTSDLTSWLQATENLNRAFHLCSICQGWIC